MTEEQKLPSLADDNELADLLLQEFYAELDSFLKDESIALELRTIFRNAFERALGGLPAVVTDSSGF